MLEKIQYWLATDPKAKFKILFWGIIILVLSLILAASILNRPARQTSLGTSSSSQSSLAPLSFENADGLEKTNLQPVSTLDQVYFDSEGNPYSFDANLRLNYNGKVFANGPEILPYQAFSYQDGMVFNDLKQTYIFDRFSENFISVDPAVRFVLAADSPSGITEFTTLQYSNDTWFLKRGFDASNLSTARTITSVPATPDLPFAQVHKFASETIVFFSDNPQLVGQIEIYRLTGTDLVRLKAYDGVVLSKISKNGIFLQQTDTLRPVVSLIKLENAGSSTVSLNIAQELSNLNISGEFNLARCSSGIAVSKLYCLVKVEEASSFDATKPDALIEIDPVEGKTSRLLNNLTFSASGVFVTKDEQLYILEQNSKELYKFLSGS